MQVLEGKNDAQKTGGGSQPPPDEGVGPTKEHAPQECTQMRINFNVFKAFPSDPGKAGWHFDGRANIEVLEDEIAARIEKDHDRPGWW